MIITRLEGGMGNQMFQYAVGRALSIKNDTSFGLYLDALLDRTKKENYTFRNYDLDIYNVKAEIVGRSSVPLMYKYYNNTTKDFILRGIRYVIKRLFFIKLKGIDNGYKFNESVFSLGKNAYLEGVWQSEKYFIDIRDVLIKDFKLKNPPSENMQNLVKIIEKENSLCLHVRRGDYVGDKNFEVVDKNYYDNALKYLSSNIKIDKIYVFSDDIRWCEENMKFEFPTMFVGEEYSGEKAEGHHVLMRACKYFIIPNSTFAWWSAWLSERDGKIVVAPSKWFPEKSINIDKFQDILPDDWIKI